MVSTFRNQGHTSGRSFERRRRRHRREHPDARKRQEVRRQKNETSGVSLKNFLHWVNGHGDGSGA